MYKIPKNDKTVLFTQLYVFVRMNVQYVFTRYVKYQCYVKVVKQLNGRTVSVNTVKDQKD